MDFFKKIGLVATSAIIAAIPLTAETYAQNRVSSKALTCSGAKELVNRRGVVVMSTSSTTFTRVVKNRSFCDGEELIRFISVPTKNGQCRVKICYEKFTD